MFSIRAFIRAHRCISLFFIFIYFSSWGLSWWSLWQTRVCVSSESCGSKWPLAISLEYALLIWSFGFNYFWIGECFYHDLIDYAKTLCCYYMASTYIMCKTPYPQPTEFLYYEWDYRTNWIMLGMHTFTQLKFLIMQSHIQ